MQSFDREHEEKRLHRIPNHGQEGNVVRCVESNVQGGSNKPGLICV